MINPTAMAEQYVKHWLCDDNDILWERGGHYKEEVGALVLLLQARERQVWGKAAELAERLEAKNPPSKEVTIEDCMLWHGKQIAEKCRQQALEAP